MTRFLQGFAGAGSKTLTCGPTAAVQTKLLELSGGYREVTVEVFVLLNAQIIVTKTTISTSFQSSSDWDLLLCCVSSPVPSY